MKNFRIAFIFIALTMNYFSHGQENQPPPTPLDYEIQKAQRAFDVKKYNTAANLFQKVYNKARSEEQKQKMLFMVAESYRRSNNFKKAFDWYEQVINARYPDPKVIYSYGLLLKNFERYDEAARQFYDYLFETPNDADAMREMNACYTVMNWKVYPKKFTLAPVQLLNTTQSDYSPFYAGGSLFWSSSRPEASGTEIFEWTGQKCSDIFSAKKTTNGFAAVAGIKGLVNTPYNEGTVWVDSALTTLFFTQCNGSDGKGMNCKIYVSYFQNNAWSQPSVLPFCSDSFSVGHPAMRADGKRLYFASDMPGGYGEKDIYYINYDPVKDKWGTPVNLGANVNTKDDDMFPYVKYDGMIYFSSKGRMGMGGLDIFSISDSTNGLFTTPVNLQYPINSGGDDFGITFLSPSEKTDSSLLGYLCSNREGGKGDDDIYAINVKPYVYSIKGKILNKVNATPLENVFVQLNGENNETIFSLKTKSNGEFTGELPLQKLIAVSASHPDFFKSTPVFVSSKNASSDSTIEVIIEMNPIPNEDVEFTLKGIYYDLDKYDLRPESKKVLDSLIVILRENKSLVIEIGSHTDSRAPDDYNLTLSQKRAQSCVSYLIQRGIEKDRLVPVGYGETHLVNDCTDGVDCTDEQHQQNRRTTFRVLSNDYKKKK